MASGSHLRIRTSAQCAGTSDFTLPFRATKRREKPKKSTSENDATIELLENDLKAVPSRISVYRDLPFAIFRYDPTDEWDLRSEVSY